MDIKKEEGIEARNINGVEIRDEYAEVLELLKNRYPLFTLTVEKSLMTNISDRPVSVTNRRCPSKGEAFWRDFWMGVFIPIH